MVYPIIQRKYWSRYFRANWLLTITYMSGMIDMSKMFATKVA